MKENKAELLFISKTIAIIHEKSPKLQVWSERSWRRWRAIIVITMITIIITMIAIIITKKVMVIVTGAKIGVQSSARMAGEKLYCPLGLTSNHCNLKMCWCWRWLCCPLFFLNQCHIQMLVIIIMMITMSTIYDILRWSRCNWKWICRNIQFL